jgi:diguanylate cyclase
MLSEDEDRRMHELTDQLVHFLRISPPALQDLLHMLQNYAYRLSFATEDQAQRRRAIQGLLRTMVTHTAELNQQDSTLQTSTTLQALEQPWTLPHLDQLQQQLQTLLLRQLDLHSRAGEAQAHIKDLLGESLQRLAALSHSNTVQTRQIEECAGQLEQAQGLADMAPVLEQLVAATRSIATENKIAHAALQDLQERSTQNSSPLRPQKALDTAEELARHDPLTRALNAKGLEEGLDREMARATATARP